MLSFMCHVCLNVSYISCWSNDLTVKQFEYISGYISYVVCEVL